MFLDSPAKSLEVRFAEVAGVQGDITGSWVDITTTEFVPGSGDLITTGTAAVTVITAPAAGRKRQVKEVTLCNMDSIPHVGVLQLNSNGNIRVVMTQTIDPGESMVYRPDALRGPPGDSGDSIVGPAAGDNGTPADFGVFFEGQPQGSQKIFQMKMTRSIQLRAHLAGCLFYAGTVPTADYLCTLKQNGATLGTVKFEAGTTSTISALGTDIMLLTGDLFEIVGQASTDTTLRDMTFAFSATFA